MRLAAVVEIVAMSAGAGVLLWTVRSLGWMRALGLTSQPRHAEDPWLILGGPFRLVRHPEALGWILVLLGSATARGTVEAWVVAGVTAAALALLAHRSERALLDRFGEAYRRYRIAVPFLFPFPGR